MNTDDTLTFDEILLKVLDEIEDEERRAIDAEVDADLRVDRGSDRWLPVPLDPPLIERIRAWLTAPRPVPQTGTGYRLAPPATRLNADTAGRAQAPESPTLEALTAPPAPGLDAPQFHWLPTLLRADADGERVELVLQSKDPASEIPIPLVMVFLDDEPMLLADEWIYDSDSGRLELLLEGVLPKSYRLDLSRSDQGKVVLHIASENGASEQTLPETAAR
jgi:hypothetical protein